MADARNVLVTEVEDLRLVVLGACVQCDEMSEQLVKYKVVDGVAEILLNRPPVNALSLQVIDQLLAALQRAREDAEVRVVIVASAQKIFCAGLDLDILRDKSGVEAKQFLEKLYFALNDVQYRLGKPSIAAIDGATRAGGMTIAISCDMIVAGEGATFGYPEINVGLIPALHFVQLTRLVGKHQAFGPLFLGDPFDTQSAFRMGLVSEIVPTGTALDRARVLARRFAEAAPKALLETVPATDRVVRRAAPGFYRTGFGLLLLVGAAELHPVAVLFEHFVQVGQASRVVMQYRFTYGTDNNLAAVLHVLVHFIFAGAGRRFELPGIFFGTFHVVNF